MILEELRSQTKLSKERILAVSIGLVYLWFGSLKFFPGISPAEDLAVNTIQKLFLGLPSASLSSIALAVLEVGIGLCLVFNCRLQFVIWVALGHMLLTFTPFFFFPDQSFRISPFVPTMIGQYIAKNIIIICALWMIYPESVGNASKIKV